LQHSANKYILVINGKPEGPFSVEELKGFGLKPGDFVKTPEMPDYKEAHEITELRQVFHFKQQSVIPQYFAGLDQRMLAGALDLLAISGIFIILGFTAVLVITDRESRLAIALSLLVLIPVTNFIYHVVMESSDKQATWGKQVLKIKVCDMEGKRISTATALVRNFCKLFSFLPLFIGYLLIFFNKQQQCAHDMIAGTLVMKDRLI
jgi:uncharacterized RDD family membrane protein YckC